MAWFQSNSAEANRKLRSSSRSRQIEAAYNKAYVDEGKLRQDFTPQLQNVTADPVSRYDLTTHLGTAGE